MALHNNGMKYSPLVFLFSLFVLLSTQSCYYDVEEVLYAGVGCDSVDVTYSQSILPILHSNCYICHNEIDKLGGINLEGYDNLLPFIVDGSFEGSVNHTGNNLPMPLEREKMNDCNLAIINKWLAEGAKNN